jgi:hypothetical protein
MRAASDVTGWTGGEVDGGRLEDLKMSYKISYRAFIIPCNLFIII